MLLAATTVHADMTAAEKAELKELHLAGVQMDIVLDRLGQIAASLTTGNRARWVLAMNVTIQLQRKVSLGLVRLAGVDASTNLLCNTSCKTAAFAAELHEPTNWCVSGCLYETGKTNLDSLAGEADPVGALAAAASTALTSARTLIVGLDSTLAYATGLPTSGTTSDGTTRHFGALSATDYGMEHAPFSQGPSANTTGGHGDYVLGVADMNQAMGFFLNGLDTFRLGADWVTNTGDAIFTSAQFTALGHVFTNGAELLKRMRLGVLALTDTPIDATECAMSQGEFIFQALGHLVDHETGMPFYFERMSELALPVLFEATAVSEGRPIFRAYFKSSTGWHAVAWTAWRYSDGVVWTGALEFPLNVVNTLRALHRQLSKPNNGHGAPLC